MASAGDPERFPFPLVLRGQEGHDLSFSGLKTALLRQVRGQDDAPDELEVEFGIQISLEVGAYIAAASSTANFRVTMRWRSHDV